MLKYALLSLAVMSLVASPALGESSSTSAAAAKPQAEVRLQILKPDGTALANGKVSVRSSKGTHYALTPTDVDGWATVDPFGRFGTWQVAVWAPGAGYCVSELFEVKKGEAPPQQTLRLKAGGTLTGRVVDKETGAPVAKVHLVINLQADTPSTFELGGTHHFPIVTTETGGDGIWTVSGLRPGPGWDVSAFPERGSEYLEGDNLQDLALAEGQTVKCPDIRLERGADIRGVVLASESKTPLAGATVQGYNVNLTTSTDPMGEFVLRGFRVGEAMLAFSASGCVPQKLKVEIPTDKKVAAQRIVLSQTGGTIRGTVVDEGGQPVAGALALAVETQGYEQFFGQAMQLVTTETWSSYKGFGELRGTPEQRTDAAGRFEFTKLAEGNYLVMVVDEARPQLVSDAIAVEAGKAAPAVKLTRMRKPVGFLAERLLKPDGSPLGAAEIQGSQTIHYGQGWSSGGLEARTNSEGRFYLIIQRSGTLKVSLAIPGYRLVELELEVDPEKSYEQDVKLTAEKADAEITGKILRPDGQPAVGVLVVPFVEGQPWPGYFPMSSGGKHYYQGYNQAVETGSDGIFHLGGLRPGVYELLAQTEKPAFGFGKGEPLRPELAGYCTVLMAEKVKVAESERASVAETRVVKGAKLTVTVTDAASGRPLANGRITIHPVVAKGLFQRQLVFSLKTDAQGRAQVDGLIPGKYNVSIVAPKHQPLRLEKDNALVLESGQEMEIKVPLSLVAGEEPEKSVS